MTGPEFKQLRRKFGSQDDVATALRTPLRTLQDWESKDRKKVPGVAVSAMLLLLNDTERLLDRIMADMEARLDREFPNGIVSEV